jgi:HlyD family secretion protein
MRALFDGCLDRHSAKFIIGRMIKNGRLPRRGLRAALLVAIAAFAVGCARASVVPAEDEVYQGTAELDERDLAFEVGGRLTEVNAREGDEVRAGALLATIDGALDEQARLAQGLEARAAQAQATVVDKGVRPEEIAATRARLRAARSAEELAQRELKREQDLNAQGATPASELDRREADYARTVAEREALESQLNEQQRGARPEERVAAQAKADAAAANVTLDALRLEKRDLRAPADAVVLDAHLKTGEVVAAGTPVFTLADPKRPYAYVFVPQAKLSGIDFGDRASIRADGLERVLGGHVENVARRTEFTPRYLFSESERANLVVRVKVRIDDPNGLLHAGVPVRVSIDRNTPPNARVLDAAPPATPSNGAAPRASAPRTAP